MRGAEGTHPTDEVKTVLDVHSASDGLCRLVIEEYPSVLVRRHHGELVPDGDQAV